MSPSKPDAATASNAKLLGQFFPSRNICTLPWLGKNFPAESALKVAAVRRALRMLVRV
jgi:hypothetical protein